MNMVTFISDYSPTTKLHISRTDDGDIVLKIHGDGEMRITMDGGKLHGEDLVRVSEAFSTIMDVFHKCKED